MVHARTSYDDCLFYHLVYGFEYKVILPAWLFISSFLSHNFSSILPIYPLASASLISSFHHLLSHPFFVFLMFYFRTLFSIYLSVSIRLYWFYFKFILDSLIFRISLFPKNDAFTGCYILPAFLSPLPVPPPLSFADRSSALLAVQSHCRSPAFFIIAIWKQNLIWRRWCADYPFFQGNSPFFVR